MSALDDTRGRHMEEEIKSCDEGVPDLAGRSRTPGDRTSQGFVSDSAHVVASPYQVGDVPRIVRGWTGVGFDYRKVKPPRILSGERSGELGPSGDSG